MAEHAGRIGDTEKRLARAVTASMGRTAKAFKAARIVLAAERLLLHANSSVATGAEELGHDEATNFRTFFRREAQSTPAEFRQQQRAAS